MILTGKTRKLAWPLLALVGLVVGKRFDDFVSEMLQGAGEYLTTLPVIGTFLGFVSGLVRENFFVIAIFVTGVWIGRVYESRVSEDQGGLILRKLIKGKTDWGNAAWEMELLNNGPLCEKHLVCLEGLWKEATGASLSDKLPLPFVTHGQASPGRSGRFTLSNGQSKLVRLCEVHDEHFGICFPLERETIVLLEIGATFVVKVGCYGNDTSILVFRVRLTKDALACEQISGKELVKVGKLIEGLAAK